MREVFRRNVNKYRSVQPDSQHGGGFSPPIGSSGRRVFHGPKEMTTSAPTTALSMLNIMGLKMRQGRDRFLKQSHKLTTRGPGLEERSKHSSTLKENSHCALRPTLHPWRQLHFLQDHDIHKTHRWRGKGSSRIGLFDLSVVGGIESSNKETYIRLVDFAFKCALKPTWTRTLCNDRSGIKVDCAWLVMRGCYL